MKAYGDMPHLSSKVIKETSFEVVIGETSFDFNVCHLWLLYWSRDGLLDKPANDHECSWINVVFDSNSPSVEVIKCAVRLIYEQDVEEFNQTIAQRDVAQDVEEFNQTIAQRDVAFEGLDCVHREFENSTVVKGTKIMRTYEDNNEAERSASWSFPEETESGNDHLIHPSCYKYFLYSCSFPDCLSKFLCRFGLFRCCIGIYWVGFFFTNKYEKFQL